MLLLEQCSPMENHELTKAVNKRKLMDVMVVDDNSQTRRALIAFFSLHENIRVSAEASNGQEAINLIKDHIPDIILMDAHMPVMDGLEATRIIKKTWPQIKIVLLTMYSHCEPEAIVAGADKFLRKDCHTEMIITTLQNLFHADNTGEIHPKPVVENKP